MYLSTKVQRYFDGFILDESAKDLVAMSSQTPEFVQRAKKQIFTYYQSVDKEGLVTFMTPSGTEPGKFYYQRILLTEFKELLRKYGKLKSPLDIVKLALKGKVQVSCKKPSGEDEDSFLYFGFKYKATQSGYNLGSAENRYPEIRNPRLKGSVCKHLRAVLAALPFHATVITKDLKRLGVF